MKEVITFRADNITLAQMQDIKNYIIEEYHIKPTMSEIIRACIENYYNDIISKRLYESDKKDN